MEDGRTESGVDMKKEKTHYQKRIPPDRNTYLANIRKEMNRKRIKTVEGSLRYIAKKCVVKVENKYEMDGGENIKFLSNEH